MPKQSTSQKNEIRLATMSEQIKNIQGDISEIKSGVQELTQKIDHTYATKEELRPVKAIAYGLVGMVLTAVVAALLALVIRQT